MGFEQFLLEVVDRRRNPVDSTPRLSSSSSPRSSAHLSSPLLDPQVESDIKQYLERDIIKPPTKAVANKRLRRKQPGTQFPHPSQLFLPRDKHRLLDEQSVRGLYSAGCNCASNCLWTVPLNDVFRLRLVAAQKQLATRRLYATDLLRTQRKSTVPQPGAHSFALRGPNNEVLCVRAWQIVYGVGGKLFRRARSMALQESPIQLSMHGNEGIKRDMKSQWILAFLQNFYDRECDEQVTAAGRRLLAPADLTHRAVHNKLKVVWELDPDTKGQAPSYSLMCQVFNGSSLKHTVKWPVKGDWGLCNVCQAFKVARRRGWASEVEKAEAVAAQEKHRLEYRSQREMLNRAVQAAQEHPEDTLLLMFDYTRSVHLPNVRPNVKAALRTRRLKMLIGGAINVSNSKRYLFTHTPNVPKDANQLITLLYHLIFGSLSSDHPVSHARKLHVHVDGGSENWNTWMLAFAAVLQEKGIFDEVLFTRGVVGHTHDRVDQMFSTFRRMLARTSICTLPELVPAIENAFPDERTRPQLVYVAKPYSWKAWFHNHINILKGFRPALGLRFSRNTSGETEMTYKTVPSLEADWYGVGGVAGAPGFRLLRRGSPPGFPHTVDTQYEPTRQEWKEVRAMFPFLQGASHQWQQEWLRRIMVDGCIDFDVSLAQTADVGTDVSMALDTSTIDLRAIFVVPESPWDRRVASDPLPSMPAAPYTASRPAHIEYKHPHRVEHAESHTGAALSSDQPFVPSGTVTAKQFVVVRAPPGSRGSPFLLGTAHRLQEGGRFTLAMWTSPSPLGTYKPLRDDFTHRQRRLQDRWDVLSAFETLDEGRHIPHALARWLRAQFHLS